VTINRAIGFLMVMSISIILPLENNIYENISKAKEIRNMRTRSISVGLVLSSILMIYCHPALSKLLRWSALYKVLAADRWVAEQDKPYILMLYGLHHLATILASIGLGFYLASFYPYIEERIRKILN
jgi:hypothetical protein